MYCVLNYCAHYLKVFYLPLQPVICQRRGAESTLTAVARHFGSELFTALPQLWTLISEPLQNLPSTDGHSKPCKQSGQCMSSSEGFLKFLCKNKMVMCTWQAYCASYWVVDILRPSLGVLYGFVSETNVWEGNVIATIFCGRLTYKVVSVRTLLVSMNKC